MDKQDWYELKNAKRNRAATDNQSLPPGFIVTEKMREEQGASTSA